MHVGIIGNAVSGKGTVAEVVLRILAGIRGKGAPRALIVADQGQAVPYLAARPKPRPGAKKKAAPADPLRIVRVKSLTDTATTIKESAGGVVVIETMTGLHAVSARTWLRRHRERAQELGYRPPTKVPVEGWVDINQALRDLLNVADTHDVDLIQVHREGPLYVYAEDGSAEEREGVRARGMGEANMGDNMTIHLTGGVRSKGRPSGDRRLWVLADASGLRNGQHIDLINITSPTDRKNLDRLLKSYLTDSLKECRRLHREDVEGWLDAEAKGLDEDDWTTARSTAEAPEIRRQLNIALTMIKNKGLDGQAKKVTADRERILEEIWGRGRTTLKALEDLPLSGIEAGVRLLSAALQTYYPNPNVSTDKEEPREPEPST